MQICGLAPGHTLHHVNTGRQWVRAHLNGINIWTATKTPGISVQFFTVPASGPNESRASKNMRWICEVVIPVRTCYTCRSSNCIKPGCGPYKTAPSGTASELGAPASLSSYIPRSFNQNILAIASQQLQVSGPQQGPACGPLTSELNINFAYSVDDAARAEP
jgi:hypothetical protein